MNPSLPEVQKAISVLFTPGQVVELRAITKDRTFTSSGYYSDFTKMSEDIIRLSNDHRYESVYWSLQEVNSALLARSPNHLIDRAKTTTSDSEVLRYRWLIVDIDSVRPAGISSSEEEKKSAHQLLEDIHRYFLQKGCIPVIADSGNGFHCLVRIDLPASDASLVQRVLESLAARFDTAKATVDRKVYNPARILKAYGSIARKGGDTADRPHRLAKILNAPDNVAILDRAVLEEIAAENQTAKKKKQQSDSTKLEQFMDEAGIAHGEKMDYKDGVKWQLDACPFNPEHRKPDVIVTLANSGAMGFYCAHNSCAKNRWDQFRALLEKRIGHRFSFQEEPKKKEPIIITAVSVEDYCREAPKEFPYIIKGILYNQTSNMLMGSIKAGKTTYILAAIKNILCGQDFIGQPTKPTNILYVTEQPRHSFQAQLTNAGLDRHTLLEQRLAKLHILDLGHLWSLDWEGRADAIRENANKLDCGLVIVDTFARIALIEELQNAGEMNRRFEQLAPICVSDGRTLLLGWHERKAGGAIHEAAAGTAASGGAMDMLLRLQRAQGAKLNDRTRQFEQCGRMPVAFEEAVTITLNHEMNNYACLGTKPQAVQKSAEGQVLSLVPLDAPGRTREEIIAAIQECAAEQGIKAPSDATIRRAIDRLVERGLLKRSGSGVKNDEFRYTGVSNVVEMAPTGSDDVPF